MNLTAREHYICHLLLARIYDDHKMWRAVTYMRTGNKEREKMRFNSRLYEVARKRCAKFQSEFAKGMKWSESQYQKMKGRPSPNKGVPCPLERREKISAKLKGRKLPEEVRMKMKGRKSPMKGKHLTDEQKKHLSRMLKGRKLPEAVKEKMRNREITQEYRDKMSKALKGHPVSEETKRRISEAKKGHKYGEEVRRRMSVAHKGKRPPNFGKKLSDEQRRRLSDALKGRKAWNKGKHTGLNWFNDGSKNILAKECPQGFIKGRLPWKK